VVVYSWDVCCPKGEQLKIFERSGRWDVESKDRVGIQL